jgi:hypothetical protein
MTIIWSVSPATDWSNAHARICVLPGSFVFVFISLLWCYVQYRIWVPSPCLYLTSLILNSLSICVTYFQILTSTYGLVIRTEPCYRQSGGGGLYIQTLPRTRFDINSLRMWYCYLNYSCTRVPLTSATFSLPTIYMSQHSTLGCILEIWRLRLHSVFNYLRANSCSTVP